MCQSTDAAREAAQHPQVKSAYIRDGSKYVQRGQTMVSHSFASTLSPEISLQCLALIVVLLADVCVHDDNTMAQWHQSPLVKVLLLVYGLRMTWFLQRTSLPWMPLLCTPLLCNMECCNPVCVHCADILPRERPTCTVRRGFKGRNGTLREPACREEGKLTHSDHTGVSSAKACLSRFKHSADAISCCMAISQLCC